MCNYWSHDASKASGAGAACGASRAAAEAAVEPEESQAMEKEDLEKEHGCEFVCAVGLKPRNLDLEPRLHHDRALQ